MNVLATIRNRFRPVLTPLVDSVEPLLEMIRPAQDARFGDYQANLAMPMGKQLGRSPREVAAELVSNVELDDVCLPAEIAGPGFINLRLRDSWLVEQLAEAVPDDRLAVSKTSDPRTYVLDYSSPNVAKPMHVGHIRSTVIGDAICRVLRFVGHQVISDNHLGDWGTQFGMIIYGYKHFVDSDRFAAEPVAELGRLYKLVQQLVQYRTAQQRIPELTEKRQQMELDLQQREQAAAESKDKKKAKEIRRGRTTLQELDQQLDGLKRHVSLIDSDASLAALAAEHPNIDRTVLAETAKLHAGDDENLDLWRAFLPECLKEIKKIYDRIDVHFDEQLGESFYHDRLQSVVDSFVERGLCRESDGAQCVFLTDFKAPMIIRKQDGAFLYATTDLATIQYRIDRWDPDEILYVVDFRQHEHFEKLFAAARLWLQQDVELRHISFGTVLGKDNRPYRTRAGDVVGLEGLLDEAVQRAYEVVSANDDRKPNGAELSTQQRHAISRVVGHAAIKYADLSHNRTSDYVFSYDKMVAMEGNTATYMQYSYARMQSIFTKGKIDTDRLRADRPALVVESPFERCLALELLRFEDAVAEMLIDYRPNILTNYLFSLATHFSRFYQQCDVLNADPPPLRDSRLLLCVLASRTIRLGLALLGIDVVDKM